MSKTKMDISPEMLNAYLKHLDGRAAACRAEIAVQEKHLKRIESRRANPEAALKYEIGKGSLGVYKEIGLPTPPSKQAKQKVKEQTFREQEKEVTKEVAAVKVLSSEKSDWDF